jgi:AhpD family alkylhydroperoxidase
MTTTTAPSATSDTPAQAPVPVPVRFDVDALVPAFSRAMSRLDGAATAELDRVGIEPVLRDLLRLRASQINGCAYCVDVHSQDARAGGETEQRLHAVVVWRESPFFTARERAALAFTEAVTLLADDHVPEAAVEAVRAQFSPEETAALLALVVTINAWNALAVTSRAWTPVLRDGATSS